MSFIRCVQNCAIGYTSTQPIRILLFLFDLVSVICFSVRFELVQRWVSTYGEVQYHDNLTTAALIAIVRLPDLPPS